ncbi:hypothetical protein [Streptomyces virginiae]|uniref:hypothetical protein n=1 Tax=Streptomyces virginiae TaxID=1961 RepID=UPI002DD9597A|nr:hypothetical protein [Streptomyces virginiae]WSC77472.1 hypothetical protein OHA56_14655 [Streptomyces virginiae]
MPEDRDHDPDLPLVEVDVVRHRKPGLRAFGAWHHRAVLTEEDARRLVRAEITQAQERIECELGILRVQQVSFGWLFYWGAVGEGQSGQRPRLGGNGPFLVDRENERLIRTATGVPVARAIADYERRLRREAHARNAAAKRSVTQLDTTTRTTVSVHPRPSV